MFFVSVADKGLSVAVSGLESTVVGAVQVLILKGFAVQEEAAVVVEVEGEGISVVAGCGVGGAVRGGLSGRAGDEVGDGAGKEKADSPRAIRSEAKRSSLRPPRRAGSE